MALSGVPSVSLGAESASRAIDGNNETLWSAGAGPPQSYQVTLDKFYQVARIELVVATHGVILSRCSPLVLSSSRKRARARLRRDRTVPTGMARAVAISS